MHFYNILIVGQFSRKLSQIIIIIIRVEAGHGMCRDNNHSRPADVLVEGWERGQPAVFIILVFCCIHVSMIYSIIIIIIIHIVEAGISPGAAAKATEERKHRNNDAKCEELG